MSIKDIIRQLSELNQEITEIKLDLINEGINIPVKGHDPEGKPLYFKSTDMSLRSFIEGLDQSFTFIDDSIQFIIDTNSKSPDRLAIISIEEAINGIDVSYYLDDSMYTHTFPLDLDGPTCQSEYLEYLLKKHKLL